MRNFLISEPGAALALGAALLYTIGFVLVNGYLGRFGVVDFSLLLLKYLSAGLLFTIISAIPVSVGWMFWPEFRSLPEEAGIDRVIIPLTVSLLVLLILWHGMLTLLLIKPRFHLSNPERVFTIGLFLVGMMLGLSFRSGWPTTESGVTLYHVSRVGIWIVGIVATIFMFMHALYGQLKPSLGGGGGWSATVAVEPNLENSPFGGVFASSVAIVDRTQTSLWLVACEDGRRRTIEVPLRHVRLIEVEGMISLDGYCPKEDEITVQVPRLGEKLLTKDDGVEKVSQHED